jgi:hypothetical protein
VADKPTLDTVKTNVDTVKTNVDTANTNVGSNADAASVTGSLHAKIKELRTFLNTLIASVQKPRGIIAGNYTASTTSYVTALSVTGKGTLRHLFAYKTTSNTYQSNVKVIADGVTVGWGQLIMGDADVVACPAPAFWAGISEDDGNTYTNFDTDFSGTEILFPYALPNITFKTSLQIQMKKRSTSYNGSPVYWIYEKE